MILHMWKILNNKTSTGTGDINVHFYDTVRFAIQALIPSLNSLRLLFCSQRTSVMECNSGNSMPFHQLFHLGS